MVCYSPLEGWYSHERTKNGKRQVVFNASQAYTDRRVTVPCGRCIGCRLDRSRQWAVRCVHEATCHEHNSFITLTYNPEHLPKGGTLVKEDFQKFMKRLRRHYYGKNIRYYHCGEYGTIGNRPHYHACLFNHDFDDKILHSQKDGIKLYTSKTLEKIWPFGFSTIGDVTFESAAYCARYIMKKITGEPAAQHYNGRLPEYTTMSRRPGIGRGWLDKYASDVYNSDMVVIRDDIKAKPPKYYDSIYDQVNPDHMAAIKAGRRSRPQKEYPELERGERFKKVQAKMLKRVL